ncbi:MAG: hypothetical protein ACXW3Z_03340 [Limisphaerales bacterium]
MSKQLTVDDFQQSLNGHIASKGDEVQGKYGPQIGWNELLRILEDRSVVRYPCKIVFDAAPLQQGECAHPVSNGELPEEGFTIYVHPFFALQLSRVPYLVLYQLVLVNYGDFASADDGETFGSRSLGLAKEDYYQTLCELTDQIDA